MHNLSNGTAIILLISLCQGAKDPFIFKYNNLNAINLRGSMTVLNMVSVLAVRAQIYTF